LLPSRIVAHCVDYACNKGAFVVGGSVMLTWMIVIITQNSLQYKVYY